MAAQPGLGPPTASECEHLSRLHAERAGRNAALAADLRRAGETAPADLNERRARVDQRTADILTAYGRELEARAAPGRNLEAVKQASP